jgi:signal-transduction protein with cAMP-binding, CBS, and nucleotidyltransferase domain
LVNLTRVWAVAYGIEVTMTADRIKELQRLQIWDSLFAERTLNALEAFLAHRLWSNHVCPDLLTDKEAKKLKEALETTKQLLRISIKHFRKPK